MLEVMFREWIKCNAREYVWTPLGESNVTIYTTRKIKYVDGHLKVWVAYQKRLYNIEPKIVSLTFTVVF